MKVEKKRLDRLISQQQLTKQQIEFYTHEYQRALECAKDCNWKITKESCTELRKLDSPSKTVIDVCEKTMLVLDQTDKTFNSFKVLAKNFGYLKDLMGTVQGQTLSNHIINEILIIWKNQTIIQAKLRKTSKCASLLAQWIGYIVEFNLKRETVNSSKRKEPELEKKIKQQNCLLGNLHKDAERFREKLVMAKQKLQKCEGECEDFSEKFDVGCENIKPLGFSMHRGTASGGILGNSASSVRLNGFPNFNDTQLYGEALLKEASEQQIIFEGNNELGCCRMKFFCF